MRTALSDALYEMTDEPRSIEAVAAMAEDLERLADAMLRFIEPEMMADFIESLDAETLELFEAYLDLELEDEEE